jgi:hypothetical protein
MSRAIGLGFMPPRQRSRSPRHHGKKGKGIKGKAPWVKNNGKSWQKGYSMGMMAGKDKGGMGIGKGGMGTARSSWDAAPVTPPDADVPEVAHAYPRTLHIRPSCTCIK